MTYTKFRRYLIIAAFFFTGTALLAEQDAILKVNAEPRNAIVFVDGQAYKQHAGTLEIAPGEHKIGIYRYGFKPSTETVTLKAGENPPINVKLELVPGEVDGPWGNLEIEGVRGDYLVFLNGRSPEFCIGYVDEIKGSRVVLPPGEQHVYIVKPEGNQDVNTWYVNIIANRKATFHADRNQTTYEKWPDGEPMHSLPRYQAQGGIMALGPVGVRLDPGNIVAMGPVRVTPAAFHIRARNCDGEAFGVAWQAINGYQVLVKQNGVAIGGGGPFGTQLFDLKQGGTGAYYFETFGPGGVSMTPVTIDANNAAVETELWATPTEVPYHRVGEKVLDPGNAVLHWSAKNADSVQVDEVDPDNKVVAALSTSTKGEQQIAFSPSRKDYGPVAQTLRYRITASIDGHPCASKTTLVQVAGSIDPPETPVVAENLPPVLPQTASPLPLIGVLGISSLAIGLFLGGLRKRKGFSR
jgi:hypothetical protein